MANYDVFIDNLNSALELEIEAQKKDSTHLYKLSNGTKINSANNNLVKLKSNEYVDIPDDSPIKIKLGTGEISGILVCKSENNIVIKVEEELAKEINSCEIYNDASKLTEALRDRIEYGLTVNDKISRDIIVNGPGLCNNSQIVTGQQAVINSVNSNRNNTTVVIGPPGTGKTHTMATLALQLIQQDKKVLVVSNANIAVDNIILKIKELATNNQILKDGKVIRYGNTSDENLINDSDINAYTRAFNKNKDLYKQHNSLKANANNIKNKIKNLENLYNQSTGQQKDYIKEQLDSTYNQLIKINTEISKILEKIKSEETKIITNANVIGTTIAQICVNRAIFDDYLADVVIIDEVSMCNLAQVIATCTFAVDHILMVGDPLQLSPIVLSKSNTTAILSTDIFEFLGIFNNSRINSHNWLVLLDQQRRMHPSISFFSRKFIYGGLLKDHSSTNNIESTITCNEPYGGYSLIRINTDDINSVASKINTGSRYNIVSAFISVSEAIECIKNNLSVCIITPYRAQAALINNLIDQKGISDKVYCATIHQFQGHEADAIILDTVECEPFTTVSKLIKDKKTVLRLINVAITRARGKLIVIGSNDFWNLNRDNIIYKFIEYVKNKGYSARTIDVVRTVINNFSNIYTEIQNCGTLLFEDFNNAKHKVIININNKDLYDGTIKYIADNSNIKTAIKSRYIKDIPNIKANIATYESNKAETLINFDDDITWYGICDNKKDINLIIRINNLDFSQLIEVNSYIVRKDKLNNFNKSGLQKYIEGHRKCTKCHGKMELILTRNDKLIVKCTKCKSIEFLTQEEINDYIKINNVICSEHNQVIVGLRTKYGVCAKCKQGHFLTASQLYEL